MPVIRRTKTYLYFDREMGMGSLMLQCGKTPPLTKEIQMESSVCLPLVLPFLPALWVLRKCSVVLQIPLVSFLPIRVDIHNRHYCSEHFSYIKNWFKWKVSLHPTKYNYCIMMTNGLFKSSFLTKIIFELLVVSHYAPVLDLLVLTGQSSSFSRIL